MGVQLYLLLQRDFYRTLRCVMPSIYSSLCLLNISTVWLPMNAGMDLQRSTKVSTERLISDTWTNGDGTRETSLALSSNLKMNVSSDFAA